VKNILDTLQKNYGRSGKHTHGAEADAEMEKEIAEAEKKPAVLNFPKYSSRPATR